MEMWFKVYCPDCKSINWVCNGAIDNDMSRLDIDSFECWKCHGEYPLDEEKDWNDCQFTDNGYETPIR